MESHKVPKQINTTIMLCFRGRRSQWFQRRRWLFNSSTGNQYGRRRRPEILINRARKQTVI